MLKKRIEFAIPYPDTKAGQKEWNKKYGLNKYWSGTHHAVRSKDAKYWHELTHTYLYKLKIPKELFTKPVSITFFWNSALDLSNEAAKAKMIEDAIKKWIIYDDNKKYVRQITHCIHDKNYIGVVVEEM